MPTASRETTTRGARGQSEVLSVVLLLSVTIAGTGLIVAFGSSARDDSKRASEIDGAEHAMTQLDSKISLVGLGASTSQTVSLGVDEPARVKNDSGRMTVTVHATNGTDETEVLNRTLGAVVYENGDTAIAYQGGGVWRRTGNGTTMVSPPEVHYRDTTLTLPLVVTAGKGPLDDRVAVRKNGSGEAKYPLAGAGGDDRRNPLSEAEVNLTVTSEYYEAWGRFFERRTGGTVDYDHPNRSVTLRLVTPPKVPEVKQGVASTSSQMLEIRGGGGSDTFTDSYNSSSGNGYDGGNASGTVETVGGVSMGGKAEIRGDLVSGGGEVELDSSNVRVRGNVSYGGSLTAHKHATVDGWTADNGSVPEIDPVDLMVATRNETVHQDGDPMCEATCELTAGQYYADGIRVDGDETLTLNLSEGNISLASSGRITVDGGTIEVINAGEHNGVTVYMDDSQFSVVNGGEVTVPDERAGKFRVYGPPGVDAEFSDSRFVGMVYAPDSKSRQGEISVTTHAEVFGAVVGGRTTLQSGGVVHYDSALARSSTLPPDYEAAPHVTYLHVSVNRVNVTAT